jgi:hypothetical protein
LNSTCRKIGWPERHFGWPERRFEWPERRFEWPERRFEWPERRFGWPERRFEWPERRFEWPERRFEWPERRFEWPERCFGWLEHLVHPSCYLAQPNGYALCAYKSWQKPNEKEQFFADIFIARIRAQIYCFFLLQKQNSWGWIKNFFFEARCQASCRAHGCCLCPEQSLCSVRKTAPTIYPTLTHWAGVWQAFSLKTMMVA